MTDPTLLEDLITWLSIPSVSTGVTDDASLTAAGQWAVDRVRRSGGAAELVHVGSGGNPLHRARGADRASLRALRRPERW